MSHLCVVPDTLTKSVAPAVEVVIYAPHAEVHPTSGTGLCLGVISGWHSRMAPSSVGHSRDQTLLPADVSGSPDHDEGLYSDDMAPLHLLRTLCMTQRVLLWARACSLMLLTCRHLLHLSMFT